VRADQADQFNDEILMIMDRIEFLRTAYTKNHLSQPVGKPLGLDIISNLTSDAIKELVTIARFARKEELPIPKELSHWMIDYIANDFYGGNECKVMKAAKSHDKHKDELKNYHRHMFIINEIIIGFEEGLKHKMEGVGPKVKGNLTTLTLGTSKKILSERQYGYLLAEKKLTVERAKDYFELSLCLSRPTINRLFIKHGLSKLISDFNQSIKNNRVK